MGRNWNHIHLPLFIIAMMVTGMGLTITSAFLAQQPAANSITSDTVAGSMDTPREATATQTLHYYDDTTTEANLMVYTGEYLQVRYSLGATSIITGIVYYHHESSGVGPYDLDIRYVGDTANTVYPTVVSASTGGTWITSGCLGPTYVIDDDPYVQLESTDSSGDCLAIGADTPNIAHSYYSTNQGSSWTQSGSYEYMVDIMYESIPTLVKDVSQGGSISGTDYVDAYYATLTGGKTYEFTLTRVSGTGDLDLRLVNYVVGGTTGSAVNSTTGTGYPEKMRYSPISTTTYMLLVEPKTGVDTATYNIVFSEVITPPADDAYEENDAFGTAHYMSTGNYNNLLSADDDWYYFYSAAGKTVSAYISFTNSLGDLDLKLYNSSGNQLNVSAGVSDWERVTYLAPYSGNYYVQVYRYSGSGWNTYSMTLAAIVSGDDMYEENNYMETAATLNAGSYQNLLCADDDWYRIYVNAGKTLTVSLSFISSIGDLDLKLYNAAAIELKSSISSLNSEQVVYDVMTAGYYYVKVYLFSGSQNNYLMTLGVATTASNNPTSPGGIAGYDVLALVGASSLAFFLVLRKKFHRPT